MKKIIKLSVMAGFLWAANAQAVSVSLSTASDTFGGQLLKGAPGSNVGVILFHGRGQSNNGDVVRQLRNSLNTSGYTTLSIDNPVPVGGASFSNYLANEASVEQRVFSYFNAAVDSLVASNSNIDQIIIGGFSLGSRFATGTAAAWEQGLIDVNANVSLAGLFGVGMYGNYGSTQASTSSDINIYDTVGNLSLISAIPVLDLYGNLDSNAALFAADRKNAFAGDAAGYTQMSLGCPDFNNATFYTRNGGAGVSYTENRCHQLRNAFLTAEDALNQTNEAVVLRGSSSAPLEAAVGDWASANVSLAPVPVPAAIWLFGSGLMGLAGLARRKKA